MNISSGPLPLVTLEEFTSTDFARLISWVNDENILTQFAGPIFQYPLTDKQLYHYLAEPQRRAFKVVHQQRTVGHAEIMLSESGVAKLCRILIGDPEDRGKGLGEQLLSVLIRRCRNKYDVKEIELNVYRWNTPATRCYQKAGFVETDKATIDATSSRKWQTIRMTLKR